MAQRHKRACYRYPKLCLNFPYGERNGEENICKFFFINFEAKEGLIE